MIIDILLVVVVLLGYYYGESLSIFKRLLLIIILMLGVLFAAQYAPLLDKIVIDNFSGTIRHTFVFSLVLCMLFYLIFIYILNRFLKSVFIIDHLVKMDSVLSGVMMGVLFAFFYSGVIWFVAKSDFIPEKTKTHSYSFNFLYAMPAKMKDLNSKIKESVFYIKEKSIDSYDKIKDAHQKDK